MTKLRCPRCGRDNLFVSCWNGRATCCGYCGEVVEIKRSVKEKDELEKIAEWQAKYDPPISDYK